MSSPAGTLKLETGIPHVITVTHPRGLPVKSRFTGDQVMWTLGDGRKLYCDPYVQERMDALHVGPGTPFEIQRVESFAGNRRTVEVVVRPLNGTATVTAVAAPRDNRESHHPTPPPPPPAPAALPPAPVNGAGETHAAIMQRCYCAAVDIALATIACAEKKGLRLSAQFEDVRAMGTALLISETGRR